MAPSNPSPTDPSRHDGNPSRSPSAPPASTTGSEADRAGPDAAPTRPDPAARAEERAVAAAARAARLEERLRVNGRFRIGAFLLLVVPLLLLETSPRGSWPALIAAAVLGGVGFVLLVRRHRRLGRERDREELRERLHREALARMDRRWDDVPRPSLAAAGGEHPYATDLDVVGHASLAHLLGRVNTAPGRAALSRVLLDPLAPLPERPEELLVAGEAAGDGIAAQPEPSWHEGIAARQRAVDALAAKPDLLDELELAGREVAGRASAGRTRAFLEWAAGASWLRERRWMLHAARGLAGFNVVTLGAWLAGWIGPPVWVFGLLGAYALNRAAAPEAHARLAAAEGGEHDPARWAALLDRARALPESNPVLARIRETAGGEESGAAAALRTLRRATDVAAVRYSGLAHFPLVALFAWDVHMLARVEAWQARHGPDAPGWIGAVAELELLVSLAGLRHEHPAWSFPTFREGPGEGMSGEDLGHPLLRPASCVGNDVELPPPGHLLLVTGSNMAGKTTLLRALGTNQILALIGAPVAAAAFATRPVVPWTAMRVSDSLTEGVSFFMAELRRLRRVVEAARSAPTLFLLDEILQGTNTAERRTAARIVLRHLLATDAVGAVTTHDLTLADAPDLKERSVEIHFREEVIEEEDGRRLHFDYHLRPGPATSRNALLLLEMVGLGEDDGEEGE